MGRKRRENQEEEEEDEDEEDEEEGHHRWERTTLASSWATVYTPVGRPREESMPLTRSVRLALATVVLLVSVLEVVPLFRSSAVSVGMIGS